MVVAVTAGLVPLTAGPAAALPPGPIYLLNYGDRSESGQHLGLDIVNSAGQYSASVYLNPAKTGRLSQQWQVVFVTDTTVKLQSRQNGACIAYWIALPEGTGTGLADCNASTAVWKVTPFLNPTTYVFWTLAPGSRTCLSSFGPPGARYVEAVNCGDQATPRQQWQTATVK
jgi:hypothetical protein